MKSLYIYFKIFILIFLFCSCSSPKYFHDESSFKRQKELQSSRSANVASEIAMGVLSIFSATALDTDLEWYPSEQEFKKLNLINPTSDTMYINMLTDVFWDKNNYCDFMDIRIPPKMECKVLVPVQAKYNLYFSTTPESDDDEMFQIFTSDLNKIALKPGILTEIDSTTSEK